MTEKKNPKPVRRSTTVYFPPDVLKRVKIYGITVERDMSDIVAEAVTEYLDKRKAPPAPK